MTQAITTTQPDMSTIEQVLVGGDLSKLTPPQRVTYYNRVCESLGINPLTRPFDYILLNNKLTLYARKDCGDQLRSLRRVSIQIVGREKVEDVYVVTSRATMPDDRKDESTGAVSIANLKGEALANALMKAETKAKRRVTLSICGLGFLDESEVKERTDARPVTIDQATGEVIGGSLPEDLPLPDFAAIIDAAATADELSAIAREIEEAKKSGRLSDDARKPLAAKWAAKNKELAKPANGQAASA